MHKDIKRIKPVIKPTFNIYLANWAMSQNTTIENLSEEERKIAHDRYIKLYESKT